jgi:GT2 family glycosyltransferase
MFIDADIIVRRETMLEIVETLEEQYTDAVVGIYTARHRHESFISQYKNLWVRYSYLKSPPAIDWLFGSISGIKREAFQKLGGFDVGLLARHGHDDIELGKRFARARLNIALNMDIEVEHLKNYNLRSFIKNEFHRSFGFASLAVRFRETAKSFRMGFVNVYPEFVLSTLFSVILLVLIILWLSGALPKWYALAAVGFYLLLNIRFLNYLEQVRGLFAMIFMIPYLLLDHLVCLVGSIVGTFSGLIRGKKSVEIN